jgi:diphosphomevalonate decarboxylase
MTEFSQVITVRAPTNIALIKYWGKRDPVLNLPLNSSLSLSVNISQFFTETQVSFSDDGSYSMTLNNKDSAITKRINSVITAVKAVAGPELENRGVKIVTFNNFPTAAGMASSASGLAALTFALSKLFRLSLSDEQLSAIARLGSGSASRSLFGGIVEWRAGDSHETSHSLQVFPASHWPELRLLVLITSSKSKEVPSTDAMLIRTEQLMNRAENIVPGRLEQIKSALASKNFEELAEIIMTDSDCLHSCINATGVNYLNEISEKIKTVVRRFNHATKRVAFTFDAGPNAWILTQEADVPDFIKFLLSDLKVPKEKIMARADLSDYDSLQATASLELEAIIETSVSETGPVVISN